MRKRFLATLLAICLIVSMIPFSAAAEENNFEGFNLVSKDRLRTVTVNHVSSEISEGKVAFTVTSKDDASDWDQDSGDGSVDSYTYVGIYVKAPEGATSLKFNDEGKIDNLEPVNPDFFQGGEFQHWIPVAEKKGDGYHLFYSGRTYELLIQWLDEKENVISNERVTVTRNLSDDLNVVRVGTYTYETLEDAIASAENGATVELLKDVTLTKEIETTKDITIVGNGNIISGQPENPSVCFEINDGNFSITNATLTDFGGDVRVGSGTAVFKVNGGNFVGEKLTVKNFNRAGFDFVGGTFTLTDVSIDCANTYAEKAENPNVLTKGVKAGYGATLVEGTLNNVNVEFSSSRYEEWGAAAVEVYNNASVVMNGGVIEDCQNGVWVDNYWPVSETSDTSAVAVLNDVTVKAEKDAVLVYGGNDATSASLTVNGGEFTGDISVYDTGKGEEKASINGANVIGNINLEKENENDSASVGVVGSRVKHVGGPVVVVDSDVADGTGVSGEEDAVAMVGGKTYSKEELATAFAAVKPGDTLTLLKDIEYNTTIALPANVTFDGREKTITCKDKIENGAFITVGGDNTIVENLTVDTAEQVKHGVQFYCMNNGKLSNVTVNGGYYTSVIINGATNVVLENCALNPDTKAYANIEFGMGGGVTTIPSMTIDDVTFGNAEAEQIWVDNKTVNQIKATMGGSVEDEAVLAKIKEHITNEDSNDVVISIELTSGNPIDVNIDGTGSSTPGGGTPTEPTEAEPFEDVDENDWFYDEVVYVYENGLMQGTSDTAFSPKNEMDRAMLVTTLYRMEGEPSAADVDVPFTDVTEGYYVDAVAWAYANDIVSGYEDNTFQPNKAITREQYVTILHRYAQFKGMDVSSDADLSAFTDAEKVSGWAEEAMIWAVDTELMQGVTETTIAPRKTAQRCQGAALLTRFHQMMA